MAEALDLNSLRTWVGRTERLTDCVGAGPTAGLASTLDRVGVDPRPGAALPPLWHWVYFLTQAPQAELGTDGHPRRGGFLPPVPLPRRMWAGGRLHFDRSLRVGDSVSRDSEIADVAVKQGKRGALVFVTVRHTISNAGGYAIVEEQDLVYRDAFAGGTPEPVSALAPDDETFSRVVTPDPVLLFRYSALTFNAHRIHYDRTYASDVEGYPGLVVQGALVATLLLDLLHRQHPDAQVLGFSFKALTPLFDDEPFTLCGRPDVDDDGSPGAGSRFSLWARGPAGQLCMRASAEVA